MKKERLYLLHILERITMTETFTADGYETFMQSQVIQEAVIRNFEVMGEAARRISEQTRHRYPHIPWPQIIGLRNRLIHNYDAISLERVWEIVEHELPTLKPHVEAMLQQVDAEQGGAP